MSGVGGALAKKVGPMPLGAWLLVGVGGLYVAYRSQNSASSSTTSASTTPQNTVIPSTDQAPVVVSPIIRIPSPTHLPAPTPTPTPSPSTTPPPRVPHKVTQPSPSHAARHVVHYTIRSGDTLWSIASRELGNGALWPKIYAENRAVIDRAAHAHHRPGGGHWIYPGTSLSITKG